MAKQGKLNLKDEASVREKWLQRVATEASESFRDGALACALGEDVEDCPYSVGRERVLWISGWYDEDCRTRIGHVFEEHQVGWRACADDLEEAK